MKGFTLIESLVALSIVSIAITAPLYNASLALEVANRTNLQLTGSLLAQEGIEYVRTIRDNAYLQAYQAGGDISTAAWNMFTTTSGPYGISQCMAPNFCVLDTISSATQALTACLASSNCAGQYLYLAPDPSTGVTVYTASNSIVGEVQTPYVRTLQVIPLPNASAPLDVQIVSKVSWDFHGTTYSISDIDHLTPWE